MSEETSFLEINADEFENVVASGKKSVVIFTAQWCGPCKVLKPKVPAIAKEFGVPAYWMDIEKNMDITSKYKIQAVPFVMTVNDGKVSESIATNNTQKISEMVSRL